mmetsp:Transcript_28988/g.81655  ORF Transcript_28988/g.81655 Transcript_28988/m.81655 type:complete len:550 (-) Transcript_28988:41-1690(-)
MAVLGHGALALKDLDGDGGLLILVGGEGLGLLGGDDCVPGDELGHHSSHSLNSQRQRGHVEQQDVGSLLTTLTRQDASLDSSSICHSLIRVHTLAGLFAIKEVLEQLLHLGDAGGASHKHNLVNILLGQSRILHSLLDRAHGLLEEVIVELLETGAAERLRQVNAIHQGLDLNLHLMLVRQGTLGALSLTTELLLCTLVLADILLVLLLDKLNEVLHDALVEVLASQVGVTVGGQHLKDTLINGQDGDIEGTTTKVKHQDLLLTTVLLVQTVCNSSGSGLVDDTFNRQASNGACILGGLALGIIEVGRNSDDSMLNSLAQECLSSNLHLVQDHGANLLWGEGLDLALDVHADIWLAPVVNNVVRDKLLVTLHLLVVEVAADEALDIVNGTCRVGRGLVLGSISDQTLVAGEGNVRRGDAVALVVGNDLNTPVLVDANARIGGAEIDADHCSDLLRLLLVSVCAGEQQDRGTNCHGNSAPGPARHDDWFSNGLTLNVTNGAFDPSRNGKNSVSSQLRCNVNLRSAALCTIVGASWLFEPGGFLRLGPPKL